MTLLRYRSVLVRFTVRPLVIQITWLVTGVDRQDVIR